MVQNAQSSSYPKFQIILCKTDIVPKRFLFGEGWFEMDILGRKEGDGAMAFQVEKAK